MAGNITRRLTLVEAEHELGLDQREDSSFILPGITIRLLASTLQITHHQPSTPEDEYTTDLPFEYSTNGRTYHLRSEDGTLVIEEVAGPADTTGVL